MYLGLVLVLAGGCKTYDPLYCDESNECTDRDRPFCDLTGEHPESEGVARTCIPDPGGMSPSDAGSADAAPDGAADGSADGSDARPFSYPQPDV